MTSKVTVSRENNHFVVARGYTAAAAAAVAITTIICD